MARPVGENAVEGRVEQVAPTGAAAIAATVEKIRPATMPPLRSRCLGTVPPEKSMNPSLLPHSAF